MCICFLLTHNTITFKISIHNAQDFIFEFTHSRVKMCKVPEKFKV